MSTERLRLGIALLLLVPAGFLVKFAVPGAFGWWCNLYGAAVLYEVFWVVFLRIVFPRLAPSLGAAVVFVLTCILEVLQLWHPSWLDAVRATFLGAAFLGTSFDPWDFPHYAIGSVLGGLFVYAITRPRRGRVAFGAAIADHSPVGGVRATHRIWRACVAVSVATALLVTAWFGLAGYRTLSAYRSLQACVASGVFESSAPKQEVAVQLPQERLIIGPSLGPFLKHPFRDDVRLYLTWRDWRTCIYAYHHGPGYTWFVKVP